MNNTYDVQVKKWFIMRDLPIKKEKDIPSEVLMNSEREIRRVARESSWRRSPQCVAPVKALLRRWPPSQGLELGVCLLSKSCALVTVGGSKASAHTGPTLGRKGMFSGPGKSQRSWRQWG